MVEGVMVGGTRVWEGGRGKCFDQLLRDGDLPG